MITQEYMDRVFKSELGQQCIELFTTPDDKVFIRYYEAFKHCEDNDLDVEKILVWYNSFK